jgi:hypothetical protein
LRVLGPRPRLSRTSVPFEEEIAVRPVVALALVLETFTPACFPPPSYESLRFEMHARCSSAGDEIDLLVLERGIHRGSKDVTPAHEALANAVAGRRILPPEGGWLSIDFDKEEKELANELAGLPDSVIDSDESYRDARDRLELVRSVHVERTGLFLDESGRLSLYQLWRITKPEVLLEWMNRAINQSLVEKAGRDEPPRLEFPLLDERTWERAIARARKGGAWIRIEEGSLVLDLPITRECAAKCLAAILDDEDIRKLWHGLISGATSIEVGEERTILRFDGGPTRWMPILDLAAESDYEDELAEIARQSGMLQPSAPTMEDLARLLDSLRADPLRPK